MQNIPNYFTENEMLILVLILIAISLGWILRKAWKRFLFLLRKWRGIRGESKAKNLFKQYGYSILKEQVSIKGKFFEDGVPIKYIVRPDYLVEKNSNKYIAEVKTGDSSKLENRYTRRQLLEYSMLSLQDTVLLVDIENKCIKKIRFK